MPLVVLVFGACIPMDAAPGRSFDSGPPDGDADIDVDADSDADPSGRDDDGDGWTEEEGDCDDTDADTRPYASERCNGRDDDCDGRIDEDGACDTGGSDGGSDTGLAVLAYGGNWVTDGGAFVSGAFGFSFTSVATGASVCDAWGPWTYDGPGATCPGCDWSFNLVVGVGTPVGPYCADFGVTGAEWDGFWGGWGFSPRFDFYGDGSVYVDNALLYYYSGGGYFFALAFNYGGYNMVYGNAAAGTFLKSVGYYYYYYL